MTALLMTPRADRTARAVAPVRGQIRIPARRRVALYVTTAGTLASGLLWLVFHDFIHTQGEFGPVASPLEPWWLRLHGAMAFACLWFFGLLWGAHIVNGWTARRRRWSGGAMFGLAAFLIVSGYLLYYSGDERLRDLTSVAHWGIGVAAPLVFIWHRFWKRDA